MKKLKFSRLFSFFVLLFLACNALADISNCAVDWPISKVRFISKLQYDDIETKANPTVDVLINGKPAKMLLDTGANLNVLWDASLLNRIPDEGKEKIYGHVGSSSASLVEARVTDTHGNEIEQSFYFIVESSLSSEGYAGALSPQTIADDGIMIIDFERNCFFTSKPFEVSPHKYNIIAGQTVKNDFRQMIINVDLDNQDIPLLINTGSTETGLSTELLANKPIGQASYKYMDAFGNQIPQEEHFRLIDLIIYGRKFPNLSVISRAKVGEQEGIIDGDPTGVVHYGYIGMDILKDYILYHDNNHREFRLIKRKPRS